MTRAGLARKLLKELPAGILNGRHAIPVDCPGMRPSSSGIELIAHSRQPRIALDIARRVVLSGKQQANNRPYARNEARLRVQLVEANALSVGPIPQEPHAESQKLLAGRCRDVLPVLRFKSSSEWQRRL